MAQAQAKINYDNVKVELVTIGAGVYYWEAFGHSAIRIKTDNFDQMFGFGYFDFEEEDFFLKFAKGEMQYFLGMNASEYELDDYQQQARKIEIQQLQLSATAKQQLLETLLFLEKPENRYYHYDYFLNNCTSRIRDILDEVTNGEISTQLKSIFTTKSWSDLTFPVANQTWMNLGIAMAYGLPAYNTRNQWQLSVFPATFSQDIKTIKTKTNWNADYQVFYQPSSEQVQMMQADFFKTHYAILMLVVVLLLGLSIKLCRNGTANFWLVAQSMLGVALLVLWFMTKHHIAAWNINILLFSPLAFLLVFNRFRTPVFLWAFLAINVLWLIAAMVLTNLYLLGFCLANMLVLYSRVKGAWSENHSSL